MSAEVLFEIRAGVARITLNRPAVKNAMTPAMCADIAAFIAELRADAAVRVLVIAGNGPDFTAGADLKAMSTMLSPSPGQRSAEVPENARRLAWPIFLGLHELRQPIIASVRGHVIGAGVQMVLSADLSVASETARLLLPQVRLGHNIDHGESYYLPRKIGMGRAMQLTLLGETINAVEAERFGLVNWVVPDDALETKTEEIVQRIATGATVAMRQTKELLLQSLERGIEEQLAAEVQSLGVCAGTEDFVEAVNAFVAKRKPAFKGQ